MARVFSKTSQVVIKFVCCLLLSACMQAGHHVTIEEPIKSQDGPQKTKETRETPIILKPLKPLKSPIPPLILLFDTHESKQYDQTITAFKAYLTQNLPEAEYMYYLADSNKKIKASQFISTKTKSPPAIIISLGASAAEITQTAFPDTPVLSTMISHGNMLRHKGNSAAILLQVPVNVQLQWIKQILPKARRVGILYDPALSRNWIEEAQNAALGKNIVIIPYEINSPKQLQEGLKYISRKADVLLAIPDPTVYSGKTAKEVLLFSYRNRIPFVGLSSTWVKAGALYAIEIDYSDLGRQIAALAVKILTEGSPGKTNLFHPDGAIYSLNMKTKDYLRLEIANDIIKGASIIFD